MTFLSTLAYNAVKFVIFLGLIVGGFNLGVKMHDKKSAK